MCGRYTLSTPPGIVKQHFRLSEIPGDLKPRYNISPSQRVAVVANGAERRLEWLRWGLIPSWAKDETIGSRMINARAETADTKPSFRSAMKRRRCLVPASGFYEWEKVPGSTRKQPHYMKPANGEVFAFAGGRRKGRTEQYNPLEQSWHEGTPLEYDGLEMAMVRFSNGVLGKVSVNFEGIQPYAFPVSIFGDRGTIKDDRLYAPARPGHKGWTAIPGIRPDSSDVSHHPFQAQADHFIDCLLHGVESHCNLADAVKTHEVVFAALECYRTGRPVKLPMA